MSVFSRVDATNLFRDTVCSVGLVPKRLPFTTSNTIVRTFRHALSLDERRAKFKANLWNRPTDSELVFDSIPTCRQLKRRKTIMRKILTLDGTSTPEKFVDSPSRTPPRRNSNSTYANHANHFKHGSKPSQEDNFLSELESKYGSRSVDGTTTDVEEVWFSGCHAGVFLRQSSHSFL